MPEPENRPEYSNKLLRREVTQHTELTRGSRTLIIRGSKGKRVRNKRSIRRLISERRFELLGVGLFLLCAGALVATTATLYQDAGSHRVSMAADDEAHAAKMRHDALASAIESAVSDILFLRELNELGVFLAGPSTSNSDALTNELVAFARARDVYDQIRVLDHLGMELVRVNRGVGTPYAVPIGELQDKGDRAYFQEMTNLDSGSIYISKLDLNVENGTIEEPLKPVLRFGVRVGEHPSHQAYLLLNLLGAHLLDAFGAAHQGALSGAYLLDSNGYWLKGPNQDAEWGGDLRERASAGFQFQFPDEWARMGGQLKGQFETRNGLFTFGFVAPCNIADRCVWAIDDSSIASDRDGSSTRLGPQWVSASILPPETLRAIRSSGLAELVSWNVVGVLALAVCFGFIARKLRARADVLRQAHEKNEVLSSTLGKYMHKEIRDRLLADPSRHGRLGGEAQDVVVLFADIRGFTRFTEVNEANRVVGVLNRTLTELAVPLRIFDGILDKYIGDGFLAFFETKPGAKDAAQRAIEAARMMQTAFRNLWHDAPSDDLRELGLGIGVSAGRVVVGNVGSEHSMDYTVVGDAVNVASRLEGMAKHGETLLCGAVNSMLQGGFSTELVHKAGRVRGRGKPLEIHRLA